MGYPLFTGNSTIESFFTLFAVLIFLIIFYLIKMFKSNVEVDHNSAGGSVKKVKVSVVKEEPTTTATNELTKLTNPTTTTTEPAFTLPSDSKIID